MVSVDVTPEIGGEVRALRKAAGFSQQRVAEMADCSVSMVRLLESGWRPEGHSAVLDRVAAVLTNEERQAGSPDALQSSARQGRHGSEYPL